MFISYMFINTYNKYVYDYQHTLKIMKSYIQLRMKKFTSYVLWCNTYRFPTKVIKLIYVKLDTSIRSNRIITVIWKIFSNAHQEKPTCHGDPLCQ